MGEDFRGSDRAFGAVARFDKKGNRKSTLLLISSMLAFFILSLYLAYDLLFVTPDAALDDKVCCSGLTVVFSIAMILLIMTFLENTRPDEVYLYRNSIRHYRGRRLVSEMVLDKSVIVHVSIDKDRYPPIRAVRFTREHDLIDIDSMDGYNAFDMVTAWDSIREVVRSNEVQTTEGFDKYARIREDTLPPPPGDPLKDLPPLTKEQTLRESVKIIEAEEHETGRAKALLKKMLEEGIGPIRSIWSRESKYRWVLTFLKAQILAVLILGAALGDALEDGDGMTDVLIISSATIVLEGLFAWFLIRMNNRQRTFFEAQVGLERDVAFRSLMGAFKALDIGYSFNTDATTMPSKKQWYDGQMVAIVFDLDGRPYTLEVLGYAGKGKALLLLSYVPEVEDPLLDKLQRYISEVLVNETDIRG